MSTIALAVPLVTAFAYLLVHCAWLVTAAAERGTAAVFLYWPACSAPRCASTALKSCCISHQSACGKQSPQC